MPVLPMLVGDYAPSRDLQSYWYGVLVIVYGPMLGGLLGSVDLHLPFYAAAALALLNGLYGLIVVPESLPRDRRAAFELRRANPFSALLALSRHREIGRLVLVFALIVLAQ